MSLSKHYDGYRSFQYLDPGVDFRTFDLAKEVDRVPPFVVPLSEEEEARAADLLENTVLISIH